MLAMSEWKPQGRGLRASGDGEGGEMGGWGMEGVKDEDATYFFLAWIYGHLEGSSLSLEPRDPAGMIPGLSFVSCAVITNYQKLSTNVLFYYFGG